MAKRKYKAEEGDDPKKKMRCPITRRHFLEAAPLLIVTIDEVAHTALPLENSTGSPSAGTSTAKWPFESGASLSPSRLTAILR
jgi:hypothetical protein